MAQTAIMIIEDEDLDAQAIEARLTGMGYHVSGIATSVHEALHQVTESSPDLALIDIHLHGELDGVDAAHMLGEQLDIPVVYLTADSDDETFRRASITKPFGYLMKPFKQEELHRTIELALYNHTMERKWRESEQRYHSLFDEAPIGLYRVTPQGQFLDVNPALVKMLGYPNRDSLLAINVTDTYAIPEDRQRFRAILGNNESMYHFEIQLRRYDGTLIWGRDNGKAIYDDANRVLYYEGSLEDITDQRHAEEQLHLYRIHLEHLVEERTAELGQAVAEAKRLNEQLQQEIVERQQTEEELRKLAKAVETMQLGVTITDIQGRIVYTNPAEAQMHGYCVDELRGNDLGIFAPPDLRHPMTLEQLAGVQNKVRESVNIRKDESVFPVRLISSLVKNEHGEPVAMVTICEDITEQKQAEDALKYEQSLLRALMDTIPDHIYFKDTASRFLRINQAMAKWFGLNDPMKAVGKTDFDFFVKEHARQAYTDEQGVMQSGQPLKGKEEKETWPDGRETWVSTTKVPLYDPARNIIGTVGISRDITEHKQTETELEAHQEHLEYLVEERTLELKAANDLLLREISERRQTEVVLQLTAQRLLTVIETVGEGITLSNESGYFEIFNSKMEQITGYTKDEANSCGDFLALLYPDLAERQRVLAGLEAVPRMGGSRNIETTIRTKDSSSKTLLVSTSVVQYEDGVWFLSAYHDITDRKRAEQALEYAKEAAESAQQAAESASQAKSEFLANMSHDLRTPLNAILGYAQILKRDTSLTEHQQDAVEVIHHSGEHLLALINDILDLSKIEAQKLELAPVTFHLPDFVKGIVEIAQIRAQQKGIGFEYEASSALPESICADEKRLRQILLNLLSNAVKFTEKGKVQLIIKADTSAKNEELRRKDEDQSILNSQFLILNFSVADTGVGIPERHLQEVFLPFHQINGKHEYTEGTGLGLAISQKLVRMMGSELRVESRVGAGSRFWFEIIVPEMRPGESLVPNSQPEERIVTGFTGERRKILIADDQKANRAFLKELLVPLGFHVVEAMNGREVLEKAREFHPNMIFLDLVMPELDGITAVRHLRQRHELQETVVVAVSANAFPHVRRESLEAGCDDFIAKPVRVKELLDTLHKYLHVEWIYGSAPEKNNGQSSSNQTPLVIPSQETVQTLFQLAQKGHLKKLLQQLDALECSDRQFMPFVSKIRQFAKSFQMDRMCAFLEHYLSGK